MSKKGKLTITFQSNLQEELSRGEITRCLLTNSASGLEQKRGILAAIMEKQARVVRAFDAVSRKLSYSFIYSVPRSIPLNVWSENFAAKTIFKLAVLYDVYKRSMKGNPDERLEAVFENVVAAVEGAKFEARKQRKCCFYWRIVAMMDSITKDSLAASAAVEQGSEGRNDEVVRRIPTEDDQKKAMRRYRALIGMGDQAVSREQLFRVVSDLVRIDPSIQMAGVTAALDQVINLDRQCQA